MLFYLYYIGIILYLATLGKCTTPSIEKLVMPQTSCENNDSPTASLQYITSAQVDAPNEEGRKSLFIIFQFIRLFYYVIFSCFPTKRQYLYSTKEFINIKKLKTSNIALPPKTDVSLVTSF